ncbi:MAG: hypothetical protein COV72_05310 [Candidatus Omnitrophica bacterium CG11_big_fil_rev_8_21_14_0_20_42_13]|uniref:Lipopolysaccharide heptosyltransferase II n=1 Tax=Candidatus Ghiorseimicrobium undicola TaxID=1974746 RepID=A0A2H0LXB0_9BACT|nr:MAG: hypothetical protein COV72_05310 [Candidatus Omnitrophica bacterium CG11_big_fil_rev_8_21_14_0_20_42_13]
MRILFITLSNIGDCVLTLPVLDILLDKYPDADISVLASPRAEGIFRKTPFIKKIFIYDKKAPLKEKIMLIKRMMHEKYDLVADLKNTILPFLLFAKSATKLFDFSKNIMHMRVRHICRLKSYLRPADINSAGRHFFLNNKQGQEKYGNYIIMAPGTKGSTKRWKEDHFIKLIKKILKQYDFTVILVGDRDDMAITNEIAYQAGKSVIDLAGKTDLNELAGLIGGAKFIVSCDSACLHFASYLNVPVIAVFGPTDPEKYGPWSEKSVVVKKELGCRPCQKAECASGAPECIDFISAEEVFGKIIKIYP